MLEIHVRESIAIGAVDRAVRTWEGQRGTLTLFLEAQIRKHKTTTRCTSVGRVDGCFDS